MEKCGKKWKMMKKGRILLKKIKVDENLKNSFFENFSEKYGKMSKKRGKWWKRVKYWWKGSKLVKNEKIIFFGFFSVKYGKMWKKVKNDEKG